MDSLQTFMLITVLKDTINELIVTNRGHYVKNVNVIEKKEPIRIRFKSKLHESIYKQLDPFQLESKKLNEVRLELKINSIITILTKTVFEIYHNSSYNLLLDVISWQNAEFDDEKQLLNEYKSNKDLIDELKKKLKNHLHDAEVKIHCRSEILATLKTELNNIKRINSLELDLVTRWEETRFEQAKILNNNREKEITETIKFYNTKTDCELRIINDLENIYKMKFENFEEKIKYWTEKYDTEMKAWEEKMNRTKNTIEEIQADYEKHQKIFEERQNFIDSYLAKKAEEQKQIDFQMKRITSAIKIQAWWRGTMVRRGLGPYKKKKKGKKGKKGK